MRRKNFPHWAIPAGLFGGKPKPLYYRYQVTTTAVNQTTTPKYTFGAGAPAAVVDWGDGSAQSAVISGTELTHAYAAAGVYTVTLIAPNQAQYLQQVDISSDRVTGSMWAQNFGRFAALSNYQAYSNTGLTGGFALSDLPAGMTYLHLGNTQSVVTGALSDCPAVMTNLHLGNTQSVVTGALSDCPAVMTNLHLGNTQSVVTGALSDCPAVMTYLYLYNTQSVVTGALSDCPAVMTHLHLYNTQSVVTGALSDLPAGMTYLHLGNTQSVVTGALSDCPAVMTYLRLYNTQSAVTGALSDLPAGMTYLNLGSTQSVITGGVLAMAAKGINEIRLDSTARTQAQVDEIINRVWTDKAAFTYATPALNVGGTNAAPSGVYQVANPPTTGKEKLYDLANGNATPAGPEWAVTYTV